MDRDSICIGGSADLKGVNQVFGFRHIELDISIRHPSRDI